MRKVQRKKNKLFENLTRLEKSLNNELDETEKKSEKWQLVQKTIQNLCKKISKKANDTIQFIRLSKEEISYLTLDLKPKENSLFGFLFSKKNSADLEDFSVDTICFREFSKLDEIGILVEWNRKNYIRFWRQYYP